MGDINQLSFIKRHLEITRGPILEVGSKDYGNTQDLRSLFQGEDYLGVDLKHGRGVDTVADLGGDFEQIDRILSGRRFNTVVCFSVLEHCRNPFRMCENISRLLHDGGLVFVSAPFAWEIHAYPSDYWRFTPHGVRLLFPGFDFDRCAGHMATCIPGDTRPIVDSSSEISSPVRRLLAKRRPMWLKNLVAGHPRLIRRIPGTLRYRVLFPPTMINMVGVKRAS